MTHIIKTAKEIRREQEHQAIAARYSALRAQYPHESRNRIIAAMLAEGNYNIKTPSGILCVLRRTNTIA